MSTDGDFSFICTEAGTFTYFCTIHPRMRATVTVGDPEPAAVAPPEEPTSTSEPPTPRPEPTSATAAPEGGDAIASDIANFRLEDLTVPVGTKVTWTNRDVAAHTSSSSEPGSETDDWDSGRMDQDGSFSFTFN